MPNNYRYEYSDHNYDYVYKMKCSYCDSDKHNISECPLDKDLDKLLCSSVEPDFNKMSIRTLKKIAALTGLKTSYPKIHLALIFKSTWQIKKKQKEEEVNRLQREITALNTQSHIIECPICMDTLGNVDCCTTKCGHKYCSTCFVSVVLKKNSCPMCRSSIIDDTVYKASKQSVLLNNSTETTIHLPLGQLSDDYIGW